VADEKHYLRTVLSEARRNLPVQTAAALAARVQARLLSSAAYRDSARVVLYASCDHEVDTALIAADVLGSGRRLYYPMVDRARRRMRLGAMPDPAELRPGAYAIPEPPAGTPALEPEELGEGTLICVPGLAFSAAGARLGRGGGYYDRMLAAVSSNAIAAGLGYSFQLLDRLPEEAWDRRLDLVVTESAVYAAGRAPGAAAQPADQGGTTRWT
jgi:5-formyltetrahydrofolate cyclo-ligase